MRVLVVDDNEINRALARAVVTRLGHKIDEASDGYEGLSLLAAKKYDLILMDISMPGLSGSDVMRRVRNSGFPNRNTQAVAWTALSKSDVPDSGILFEEYMQKPATLSDMRNLIARAERGVCGMQMMPDERVYA